MARLDPHAPIGWIGDEETSDPKDAVRKLLLIFGSVVGGLLDDKNYRVLRELLRLMQDNVDVTRELMVSIEQGASIEDVKALLERRKR